MTIKLEKARAFSLFLPKYVSLHPPRCDSEDLVAHEFAGRNSKDVVHLFQGPTLLKRQSLAVSY